jgi:D-sedoheptulose 7-phosphate isomerase
MSDHSERYLHEVAAIAARLDPAELDRLAARLAAVRDSGGRLFLLGAGGSAANASHAAADFRKLAGLEAYALTDNVAELTALTNDDGWDRALADALRASRLTDRDGLLVLSVSGGDRRRDLSPALVQALDHARAVGCTICGLVGVKESHTARVADCCIVVPTVNPSSVTAHTESFQAVIWHLLVTHPALARDTPRWESLDGA